MTVIRIMQMMNYMSLNKILFGFLLSILLYSCKKDQPVQIGEISGAKTICRGEQQVAYTVSLTEPVDYVLWTVPDDATISSGQGTTKILVNFGSSGGVITVKTIKSETSGDVKKLTVSIDCTPGKWCRLNNFAGIKRYAAFSFSYSGKGYFGGGYGSDFVNGQPINDLWEFDPENLIWSQKASNTVSYALENYGSRYNDFFIDGKYYIINPSSWNSVREFYCYDPATNTWSLKAPYPGKACTNSACFAIESRGFVCCGESRYDSWSNLPPINNSYYSNNVWRYDPSIDQWDSLSNFPGTARNSALGFTINNIAYIGSGNNNIHKSPSDSSYNLNDLWKYNYINDTWVQLNNMPFYNYYSALFSLGNKGYFIGGRDVNTYTDVNYAFSYNPLNDQWTKLPNFPGKPLTFPSAFVINDKAYLGLGRYYEPVSNLSLYSNEFYSYCPE